MVDKKLIIGLWSLCVGLVVGVFVCFFWDMVDNTVKFPESPIVDAYMLVTTIHHNIPVEQDGYDSQGRLINSNCLEIADTYWHDPRDVEVVVTEIKGGRITKGIITIKGNPEHPHGTFVYDIPSKTLRVDLTR